MTNQVKKITVFILTLTGISLVVGIATMYLVLNPATLLAGIKTIIQERTGYPVSTTGQVRLSLYPLLALHIEELSITKPTDTTPTLTLREVTISSPWAFQKISSNNWHVTLRAKEFLLQRFKANNVTTTMTATSNGNLIIESLQAECYQGTLSGTASFDKIPVLGLKWQLTLANIELSQLLRDLNGDNATVNIIGPANIHFNGDTQNLDREPLQTAMRGTLQFDMQQGNIQGLDFNYIIEKGIALLTKEKTTREMTSGTQFQQFNGIIYLADNVAKSDNINLQTDTFSARITGEVALPQHTLDASIEVIPKRYPRLTIPLLLSGPLNKPKITLDILLIQAILTKEELNKVKAKVEKEIEKIPERANKLLDSLFGNQNEF